MKAKLQKVVLVVVSAALLTTGSGCFTVKSQAPHGTDIKVLPAGAPVEVYRKFQKWFILWGLIPLSVMDDPSGIIHREKLVEVRVTAEDNFVDVLVGGLITMVSIGMISPQTVIVEGNRAPLEAPPAP